MSAGSPAALCSGCSCDAPFVAADNVVWERVVVWEHHLALWAGGFHLWTEGARDHSRLSTDGTGEAGGPPHFMLPEPFPPACLPASPLPIPSVTPGPLEPSLPHLGSGPDVEHVGIKLTDRCHGREAVWLGRGGSKGGVASKCKGTKQPPKAGVPGARRRGGHCGGDRNSDRPRGPLALGSSKGLQPPPTQAYSYFLTEASPPSAPTRSCVCGSWHMSVLNVQCSSPDFTKYCPSLDIYKERRGGVLRGGWEERGAVRGESAASSPRAVTSPRSLPSTSQIF